MKHRNPKNKAEMFEEPKIAKLLEEINEAPATRQKIIAQLEEELDGRCVISYFTSFRYPVMIDDSDRDVLEGVLQKSDLSKGLTLIINSPGGNGLAAERIVNSCRAYAHDDFEVMVPRQAKSAATMICLGANKIWMSKTAELGAIDPQVLYPVEGGGLGRVSAHSIIESYRELLEKAVNAKEKNIQPFLQQLARYDPTEIKELEKEQELVESMAVNMLQRGMMKGKTVEEIKAKIRPFVDPKAKVNDKVIGSHGRMIDLNMAREYGLSIVEININSRLWELLWELYVRTNHFVSGRAAKAIETRKHNFALPAPSQQKS